MDRVESPPPRFSETASHGSPGPRFTEHINSSPPYIPQLPFTPDSPHAPQYGEDGISTPPYHRSASQKGRPNSPEVLSPGLQSVWDDEGNKEVFNPPPQHTEFFKNGQQQRNYGQYQQYPPIPVQPALDQRPHDEGRQGSGRMCGIRRKPFLILLALLILVALAVGLGAGLGVGLNHDDDDSDKNSSDGGSSSGDQGDPFYTVGGALNPSYFTTEGAFNGSGIALASQSFSESLEGGTQGSVVMYFQHWSGQIRWQQLSSQGDWLGGDVSEVVAVDAKNATPLSAVSYSIGGRNQWHIFYVDKNNTLRQRSNSNTTNVWVDGPIGDLNLKILDADQVGMQACWYGSDYGDVDYLHTPLPNAGPDSEYQNEVGMRMWFAKDNTTFSQYGWRAGDAQWTFDHDWTNLNGHAGVGCYSWGPGNVTYTMFVDLENTVRFFWKDTNTNLTNTTTHPINEWKEASINIPGVWPSTSLGYTNAFYAQMADRTIHGFNITWDAENTTFIGADNFTVDGNPGIGGTHMSVTAVPNASGGNTLMVFYQQNGSDITEYARDLVAGQWSQVNIPIPDE